MSAIPLTPRVTSPPAALSSLGRSFSWAVLGDVVYAACQWGMVVVLAKLGTPELVGQFALGLAVTAPVLMFSNLQLRALQATAGATGGQFAPFLTLRLLATGLALLVIGTIAMVTSASAEAKAVIVLIGAFKAVEAVSDIFHSELQRRGDMHWICLSLVLKGMLALIVLTVGMLWSPHLAPVCLAITLVWLLVLVGVDAPCVARRERQWRSAFQLSWEGRALQRVLVQAIPLGLVAMLISLTVSLPRYFLESYRGEYELGVYSALASLMQACTLAAAALGTAASGRLGELYANPDKKAWLTLLARLSAVAVLFGLGGLLVSWLGGGVLLTALYSSEYAAHLDSFLWLMLAGVGLNLCYILNWALVAARRIRIQLPLHLFLLLVTAAACWGLVPSFGLLGAAVSVGVTTVCHVTGASLILWRAPRSPAASR